MKIYEESFCIDLNNKTDDYKCESNSIQKL